MTVADFIKLLQAEPEPSDAELDETQDIFEDLFGEAIKYYYGHGFYFVAPKLTPAEKYTRNLDRLYPW